MLPEAKGPRVWTNATREREGRTLGPVVWLVNQGYVWLGRLPPRTMGSLPEVTESGVCVGRTRALWPSPRGLGRHSTESEAGALHTQQAGSVPLLLGGCPSR